MHEHYLCLLYSLDQQFKCGTGKRVDQYLEAYRCYAENINKLNKVVLEEPYEKDAQSLMELLDRLLTPTGQSDLLLVHACFIYPDKLLMQSSTVLI